MKLIVGLGNPGKEYENTRHNAGYFVLDSILAHPKLNTPDQERKFSQNKKFNSETVFLNEKGEKIILAKPTTFMNLSGGAVSKLMSFYKANISNLIVVSDDVDLPLGSVRVRLEGSSGGHNGLQNIVDVLGSDQFARLRIGIADERKNLQEIDQKDTAVDTKDYVLSRFSDRELPVLKKTVEMAADILVECIGKKDQLKAISVSVV